MQLFEIHLFIVSLRTDYRIDSFHVIQSKTRMFHIKLLPSVPMSLVLWGDRGWLLPNGNAAMLIMLQI